MTSHRIHYFHLVWSTKLRQNFILPKMQTDLFPYMAGVISKNKGKLIEIGGIENHVHLLIELSNLDNFTTLIRNTKTASSSWLKQHFPECRHFAWQEGYGSYSVSYSQLEKVRKYIQNQEEHHKNITFEKEYVNFLNLCKVEYDAKYLFDT